MKRVHWIAVAEARGHLMRAHLAKRLLAEDGVAVDIATTSDAGVSFLRALGTEATRFGCGYALAFDARQNLDRAETERRLLRYLFRSVRSDLRELPLGAIVVNDSFHPALLLAPILRPDLHLVNVYGEHLLAAVADHPLPFAAARYAATVRRLCALAHARIEHTLDDDRSSDGTLFRVPPLIDVPRAIPRPSNRLAVVYLNPHFRDPELACAIERALAGFTIHAVAEGYADRPGWRAHDARLIDRVQAADLIVAAPGMGTLAQVRELGTPMVALVSDQPEQRANLRYLDPARSAVIALDRLGDLREAAVRLSRLERHPNPTDSRARWREVFRRILNGIYSNESIDHRNHQSARWRRFGGTPLREPRAAAAPSLSAAELGERSRDHRRRAPR